MTFKKKVLCSVLASLVIVPMSALAQIEEIIVTAQKRAESAQDVPISIQAMSGESLANAGITNSDDLGMVTPGLNVQQSGVGNTIFLRGLGNQDATGGQEGSVGVYVDGLWYGSVTGSALTLNSVDRIEVLKGPQGTLFGRNTTGGVINVVTKTPEQEPAGSVGVSYGSYDKKNVNFYGTRGITDTVAADISVMWGDQGEGYGENKATGNDINMREDEIFMRTKWLYSGENTDVTFAYAYEEYSDDMGYARGAPQGLRDVAGQLPPGDSRDINNDADPYADFENTAISLRVDHEFEPFEFVSITGYKDDDLISLTDNDYSPANLMDADIGFYNTAWTQEFQFISNSSTALSWIAGLFFLDSKAGSDITISGPALWYDPTDFSFSGLNDLRFAGEIMTRSYAAFGEMSYELTEAQSLTLGLRYTRDERDVEGLNQAFVFDPGMGPLPKFGGIATPAVATPDMSETYNEPTWRLVYDIQMTEDVMVYASYNRGFRSGNFNAVSPANPAFQPEFVDAFEVGMKSDLLDGELRLNAAMFYYKAKDLQFQTLEGVTAQTINAAGADIMGAEFDLTWLATDHFTVVLGGSLIDSEYKEFDNALAYPVNPAGGALPSVIVDASGNQLTKAPKQEVSLGLMYALPTDTGEYMADLRLGYNSGFPWEPDGRIEQDSYTLVNFTLGWKAPDETWGVRLLGKNLLDEEYAVHSASSSFGDFYASAAPRTVSVAVSYDF